MIINPNLRFSANTVRANRTPLRGSAVLEPEEANLTGPLFPLEKTFDLNSIIDIPKNSTASPKFIKFTKKGLNQFLESLDPIIRQGLVASGYKITVVGHPFEAYSLADIFNADESVSAEEAERHRKDLMRDSGLLRDVITATKAFQKKFPKEKRLSDLQSQLKKSPLGLTENHIMLIKNIFIPFCFQSPAFDRKIVRIIVPEQKCDFKTGTSSIRKSKIMERIIRHETWHYLDDVIGKTVNGKPFSQHKLFMTFVNSDLERARRKGFTVSDADEKGWNEPIVNYLPFYRKDAYQFSETFAEIGSASHGEGACSEKSIKRFCPRSIAMIQIMVKDAIKPTFSTKMRIYYEKIKFFIKNLFLGLENILIQTEKFLP